MSQLLSAAKQLHQRGINLITPQLIKRGGIADLFNKPNKQISQLIAQAWLDGRPSQVNRKAITELLLKDGLIDKSDAVAIVIDPEPYSQWAVMSQQPPPPPPTQNYAGYWIINDPPNSIGLYVPYPERPAEVTNPELTNWVNQDPSCEPFLPSTVWIPYTC